MKLKQLLPIALALFLALGAGCKSSGGTAEISVPPSGASESAREPSEPEEGWEEREETSEVAPEPLESFPFVVPQADDLLAEELAAWLDGYSLEFPLPIFDGVEDLPYSDPAVSTNLLTNTYFRNEEYLARGSGVSDEELERLQEPGLYTIFVRYDDLNDLGRYYFGERFLMPYAECREVGPVEGEPEYFAFLYGRGGMPPSLYVPIAVEELSGGAVEASFYVFSFNYSWDTGEPLNALCLSDGGKDRDVYYDSYYMVDCGYLEFPEGMTYQDMTDERELFRYLRLTIPQEELGQVTVIFQREPDGRFTAASCRYAPGS